MSKSPDAFRTISEVADWLDTPAHVLRFWESKFSQVKPVKRAGGRRYYRPNDMMLLGGIKRLLHQDGLTVKDVQKLLRDNGPKHVAALSTFDLDSTEASGSAAQIIEVEAESIPADAPMFTSVAPRKESTIPEAQSDDPLDQMSFPGFEFSSDRTKTFQTPNAETVEAEAEAEPTPSKIDISHIAHVDLSSMQVPETGALARLAKLQPGDLDKHLEELAQVRKLLSDIASNQATSSNS